VFLRERENDVNYPTGSRSASRSASHVRATAPWHLGTGCELARMRQTNELARQIGTIDRMREEETQRRHDAVHGRHVNTVVLLLDWSRRRSSPVAVSGDRSGGLGSIARP
jgi:hypothetical protein